MQAVPYISLKHGRQPYKPGDYVNGTVAWAMNKDIKITKIVVELIGVSRTMLGSCVPSKTHRDQYELIHEEQTVFSCKSEQWHTFRKGRRFDADFSFRIPEKVNGRSGEHGCDKIDLPPTFPPLGSRLAKNTQVGYYVRLTAHRPGLWSPRLTSTREITVSYRRSVENRKVFGFRSDYPIMLVKNRETGKQRGLFDRLLRPSMTKFPIKFSLLFVRPSFMESGKSVAPMVALLSDSPPERYRTGDVWKSKDGAPTYQSNGLGKIILTDAQTHRTWKCTYAVGSRSETVIDSTLLSRNKCIHELDLADLQPLDPGSKFYSPAFPRYFLDISDIVEPIMISSAMPSFTTDNIQYSYSLEFYCQFAATYGSYHQSMNSYGFIRVSNLIVV